MSKTVLVFASQSENSAELENKYGKYCVTKSLNLDGVCVEGIYSNRQSLSKVYNTFIKDENSITVFIHDDAYIRDPDWTEKLKTALDKYDVVGLAGGSEAKINAPCLWHIMCPPHTHRGCVSHVNDDRKGTFVTNFGKQGRVLMLDGLFLAFNTKKLFDSGVKFDESCPAGYHFYDIDFSLTCNSKKLKLGTTYIDVVHNSHGLRKFTDEWQSGQAWFMQKVTDGKYNI
ncbi:MAG: hypothetical protein EBR30_00805 [Cytophagia bacterium]|jgi:hypothetical protein|nr:hypothetical protein [Cytophagia bacterium]NBW33574.1 hypothetical protein [Cytophagia bacterium]